MTRESGSTSGGSTELGNFLTASDGTGVIEKDAFQIEGCLVLRSSVGATLDTFIRHGLHLDFAKGAEVVVNQGTITVEAVDRVDVDAEVLFQVLLAHQEVIVTLLSLARSATLDLLFLTECFGQEGLDDDKFCVLARAEINTATILADSEGDRFSGNSDRDDLLAFVLRHVGDELLVRDVLDVVFVQLEHRLVFEVDDDGAFLSTIFVDLALDALDPVVRGRENCNRGVLGEVEDLVPHCGNEGALVELVLFQNLGATRLLIDGFKSAGNAEDGFVTGCGWHLSKGEHSAVQVKSNRVRVVVAIVSEAVESEFVDVEENGFVGVDSRPVELVAILVADLLVGKVDLVIALRFRVEDSLNVGAESAGDGAEGGVKFGVIAIKNGLEEGIVMDGR
jgi:hypothetical protein